MHLKAIEAITRMAQELESRDLIATAKAVRNNAAAKGEEKVWQELWNGKYGKTAAALAKKIKEV